MFGMGGSPFLARSVSAGVPRAVVSGLGPNGVLAALELLRAGYHVTVVEKRFAYTRPIHLHLRQSYLDDVMRLSPRLHAKLMAIATPIRAMERVRGGQALKMAWPAAPERMTDDEQRVRERLVAPPVAHVPLDAVEKLFFTYVNGMTALQAGLDPVHRLTIRRGFTLEVERQADGRFAASMHPTDGDDPKAPARESLGVPDLIVLAEGGKSTTVIGLGLENVRFSYAKYFMSAHVDAAFGPTTRRMDVDAGTLEPGLSGEVSLWACGHANPKRGTWIVLEVPGSFLGATPAQAMDYFVEGAARLFAHRDAKADAALRAEVRRAVDGQTLLPGGRRRLIDDESGAAPFAGTFRFEQQCLRHPAAGKNVVVLGDSAGMGHHALSSGLEMGACDLTPLRDLAGELSAGQDGGGGVARYAERVFRSRMTLLALGMREYYPQLDVDPVEMLHAAAAGGNEAREAFEALIARRQPVAA